MELDSTQERVDFSARLAASFFDALIFAFPSVVFVFYSLTAPSDNFNSLIALLKLLYDIFLPFLWMGYTVGKRMIGIRIVKINGENVEFVTMLLRALVGGIFYSLTFGIGIIISAFMIGLRKDKRAIHDFIAGTCVIYTNK